MYGILITFKTKSLSDPLQIEYGSFVERLKVYGFTQHADNLFINSNANAVTTICSFQSVMNYHPLLKEDLLDATMLRIQETTDLLPSLSINL